MTCFKGFQDIFFCFMHCVTFAIGNTGSIPLTLQFIHTNGLCAVKILKFQIIYVSLLFLFLVFHTLPSSFIHCSQWHLSVTYTCVRVAIKYNVFPSSPVCCIVSRRQKTKPFTKINRHENCQVLVKRSETARMKINCIHTYFMKKINSAITWFTFTAEFSPYFLLFILAFIYLLYNFAIQIKACKSCNSEKQYLNSLNTS